MIETTFLDISGNQIPVIKTYEFSGTLYNFSFKENRSFSYFTVEIFDISGENFLWSSKIIYGRPIMDSTNAPFQDLIIPLNIDILQGNPGTFDITRETLGNEIRLYTNIIET